MGAVVQQTESNGMSVRSVCGALGLSRATYYRRLSVLVPSTTSVSPELVSPSDQPTEQSQAGALIGVAVRGHGDQSATAPELTITQAADLTPARSPVEPSMAPKPKRTSPRALSDDERVEVLATLNDDRFCNLAPAEVFATLLDEGKYICSERTFYRILADNAQVRERRNQLRHPEYVAPELMATGPNQTWSWDISVPQKAA